MACTRYLHPLKTYFRYDPVRHMASLEDVCISRASAKQRRGRAGRVRAGLCFHLFTSDAPLSEYTQPEVCAEESFILYDSVCGAKYVYTLRNEKFHRNAET